MYVRYYVVHNVCDLSFRVSDRAPAGQESDFLVVVEHPSVYPRYVSITPSESRARARLHIGKICPFFRVCSRPLAQCSFPLLSSCHTFLFFRPVEVDVKSNTGDSANRLALRCVSSVRITLARFARVSDARFSTLTFVHAKVHMNGDDTVSR